MRAWCAATSPNGSWWVGWLRRLILCSALFLVVLGVLGMHQLYLGHDFATPPQAGNHEHGEGHHEAAKHEVMLHEVTQQMEDADLAGRSLHQATADADPSAGLAFATDVQGQTDASRKTGASAASWGGSSRVGGDACPDCGQHSMAFGACLVAMTLLVLTWLLRRPRVQPLPPRWLRQPATVTVLVGRVLPALSLTELSVRRT